MGPLTRRALHEALDHILDAIEADARAEDPERPKRRAVRPRPPAPKLEACDPADIAKARRALSRAGLA